MQTNLMSRLLYFVLTVTKKYGIDDSHGLSHSLNVLQYSSKIYESEVKNYPILKNQENIIYVSAVLHDMCDRKYMDEKEGLNEIEKFLQCENLLSPLEINVSKQIMSTMSYSKVKKTGFPDMGCYQKAYHIVREADLLTAYDFDRCIVYQMNKNNGDLNNAWKNATELFNDRVFRHNEDGLFLFDYSRKESAILHNQALQRISSWKKILNAPRVI